MRNVQTYPELGAGGPPKFVPKIYGFKIFGMRGSKHELRFDSKGNPANEEEIKQALRRRLTQQSMSAVAGSSTSVTLASTTLPEQRR